MIAQSWNTGWKFWEEGDSFALVWNIPDNARDVTLPHDAMAERAPRPDSPNGGDTGWRDGGSYVYAKTFSLPAGLRDKTLLLRFDGVYRNAMVYLNGQLAGRRPSGYTYFDVPLADYLRWGEDNEVRVLVKNTGPSSRWYSGSGICRDVWLLAADALHLPPEGCFVTTLQADEDYAALSLSAEVRNGDCRPRQARLEMTLLDPAGQPAAQGEMPLFLPGGGAETVTQTLTVARPALWSADSPALYTCRLRLLENGRELDREEHRFGIRTLHLDAQRGFQVNGKPVKLRGACIHHDNGPLGAVSPLEAELRRVRILKQAGFNALRMAHNPASPALLQACDRLGMYVMDEALDMWTRPKKDDDYSLYFDRWWRDDLAALARRDRAHPSVVFYSLGNEIPEAGLPHGAALGREMARLVKGIDPTRFVLTSVNGVFASGDCIGQIMGDVLAQSGSAEGNVNDFMTAMDTHLDEIVTHPLVSQRLEAAFAGMDLAGYNYMTARYEPDALAHPHRVMVGSETYPPQIARNWALVERLPALVGDFTWTGWDYIGEAGVGVPAYAFGEGGFGAQFPCQLSHCADIDLTGFRRPMSYLREMVFGLRQDPYLAVQHPGHYGQALIKTPWVLSDCHGSWSWPGFEGQPVVVEVYSPGHQVELLQDGVSLGRKPAGAEADFRALFETEYRPGLLEAVAYDDGGAVIGRATLASPGPAQRLLAEAEPLDAGADQALVYLPITLADSRGAPTTGPDREVTVQVTGGQLAGLCSGDPKPEHQYTEAVTRTYFGRALAVIRRTGGPVEVNLSAPGCDGCAVTLPPISPQEVLHL